MTKILKIAFYNWLNKMAIAKNNCITINSLNKILLLLLFLIKNPNIILLISEENGTNLFLLIYKIS